MKAAAQNFVQFQKAVHAIPNDFWRAMVGELHGPCSPAVGKGENMKPMEIFIEKIMRILKIFIRFSRKSNDQGGPEACLREKGSDLF